MSDRAILFEEPGESAHLCSSVIIIITCKRLYPDSIHDSIRTKISDSQLQVPSLYGLLHFTNCPTYITLHYKWVGGVASMPGWNSLATFQATTHFVHLELVEYSLAMYLFTAIKRSRATLTVGTILQCSVRVSVRVRVEIRVGVRSRARFTVMGGR